MGVLVPGCAPLATAPLNEDQQAQVAEYLERVDVGAPCVQRLLAVADPLFDLRGRKVADNAVLVEEVGQVTSRLHDLADAGRLVAISRETRERTYLPAFMAMAWGAWTPGAPGDDFVVLVTDGDGGHLVFSDPGVLLHEVVHYYYPRNHPPSLGAVGEAVQASFQRDWHGVGQYYVEDEYVEAVLEVRDPTYLYEMLLYVPEAVLAPDRNAALALLELAEDGRGADPRSAAYGYLIQSVQVDHDALARAEDLGREEWAAQVAEAWHDPDGPYRGGFLARLGVDADELRGVLEGCDALYDHRQRTIRTAMDAAIEVFAELRSHSAPPRATAPEASR